MCGLQVGRLLEALNSVLEATKAQVEKRAALTFEELQAELAEAEEVRPGLHVAPQIPRVVMLGDAEGCSREGVRALLIMRPISWCTVVWHRGVARSGSVSCGSCFLTIPAGDRQPASLMRAGGSCHLFDRCCRCALMFPQSGSVTVVIKAQKLPHVGAGGGRGLGGGGRLHLQPAEAAHGLGRQAHPLLAVQAARPEPGALAGAAATRMSSSAEPASPDLAPLLVRFVANYTGIPDQLQANCIWLKASLAGAAIPCMFVLLVHVSVRLLYCQQRTHSTFFAAILLNINSQAAGRGGGRVRSKSHCYKFRRQLSLPAWSVCGPNVVHVV